jgi:hypothetical protein
MVIKGLKLTGVAPLATKQLTLAGIPPVAKLHPGFTPAAHHNQID